MKEEGINKQLLVKFKLCNETNIEEYIEKLKNNDFEVQFAFKEHETQRNSTFLLKANAWKFLKMEETDIKAYFYPNNNAELEGLKVLKGYQEEVDFSLKNVLDVENYDRFYLSFEGTKDFTCGSTLLKSLETNFKKEMSIYKIKESSKEYKIHQETFYKLYQEPYFLYNLSEFCNFSEIGTYVYYFISSDFKKLVEPQVISEVVKKLTEGFFPSFKENLLKKNKEFKLMLWFFLKQKYATVKSELRNFDKGPFFDDSESISSTAEIHFNDFPAINSSLKTIIERFNTESCNFVCDEISSFVIDNYLINKDVSKYYDDKNVEVFMYELYFTLFFIRKFMEEEAMELSHYYLNGNFQIFGCLVHSIVCLPDLLSIDFSANNFSNVNSLFLLGKALAKNDSIVNVNLSFARIGNDSFKPFCELVTEYKRTLKWENFDISSNQITSESAKHLAHLLSFCHNLKDLCLSRNEALGDGMMPVLHSIEYLCNEKQCSLQRVYLLKLGMNNESINKLGEILSHNDCYIESIGLSGNDFSDVNLEFFKMNVNVTNSNDHVIYKPRRFPHCREIVMCKCQLKDDNMNEIISFLKLNKMIYSFSIYNNEVTDPNHIVNLIQVCNQDHCIANLDAGANNVDFCTKDFVNKMKDYFTKQKTNLKVIDLSNNIWGSYKPNFASNDTTAPTNIPSEIVAFTELSVDLQNNKECPIQLLF